MATCPCDALVFPPIPDIPAGLDRLPRQIGGFPEFRQALLAGIALQPALDAWRAREGDDFGLMIARMVGLRPRRARLLQRRDRQRALPAHGPARRVAPPPHRPDRLRPAAAARRLRHPGAVRRTRPAHHASRSAPPSARTRSTARSRRSSRPRPRPRIASTLNTWTLAPIRPTTFGAGPLLLEPRTASLSEGQIVLLEYGATRTAARVSALASQRMLDGQTYVLPTPRPGACDPARPAHRPDPADPPGPARRDERLLVPPGEPARVERHPDPRCALRPGARGHDRDPRGRRQRPAPRRGDHHRRPPIGVARPRRRTGRDRQHARSPRAHPSPCAPSSSSTSTAPTAPFTAVTLDGPAPSWVTTADPGGLTLHFAPVPAGRVTPARQARPGARRPASLGGPRRPGAAAPAPDREPGAADRRPLQGADLAANVTDDGAGNGRLTPLSTGQPARPAAHARLGLRQPGRGHPRRERGRSARQRRCHAAIPDLPPEEEAAHLPRASPPLRTAAEPR